jgi:hypothetical protein
MPNPSLQGCIHGVSRPPLTGNTAVEVHCRTNSVSDATKPAGTLVIRKIA